MGTTTLIWILDISAGFCWAYVFGIWLRCLWTPSWFQILFWASGEEWVVAILCRCPPIKNQGVHCAKPRLLYNKEEERRPFSKGIHVTTLATPSLSSPDLRYRFRLTYPDYPRLTWSQCLQWSLWHGLCVSTLNFPNIPTGSAFHVGTDDVGQRPWPSESLAAQHGR